ncbi:hypothetical protein FBU59_002980, partial [Linderina macrospora]
PILTSNKVPEPERLANDRNVNAHVYGTDDEYFAFLVNANAKTNVSATFRGQNYDLHRWSVTLVKKDKDKQPAILYNTAKPSKAVRRAQHHPADFEEIPGTDGLLRLDDMRVRTVGLPDSDDMTYRGQTPHEQITLTKDTSDYLWYRAEVKIPESCRKEKNAKIVLQDAGDLVYAYLGDAYVGMAHGRHDTLATFTIDIPSDIVSDVLSDNTATLTLLSQTMGMAHNQYNMEAYYRGLLGNITVCGIDITSNGWVMEPTLEGTEEDPPVRGDIASEGSDDYLDWDLYDAKKAAELERKKGSRLRWYAVEIDTDALRAASDPSGEPTRYAIDLGSMTKGHVWVNGHHLGRYWTRKAPEKSDYKPCQVCDYGGWFWPDNVCRQKCGEISQRFYHLPPGYLNMHKSVLYVLEEMSGDPRKIAIVRRVSESPVHHVPETPVVPRSLSYYAVWLVALVAGSWTLCRAYHFAVSRRGYQPIPDQ